MCECISTTTSVRPSRTSDGSLRIAGFVEPDVDGRELALLRAVGGRSCDRRAAASCGASTRAAVGGRRSGRRSAVGWRRVRSGGRWRRRCVLGRHAVEAAPLSGGGRARGAYCTLHSQPTLPHCQCGWGMAPVVFVVSVFCRSGPHKLSSDTWGGGVIGSTRPPGRALAVCARAAALHPFRRGVPRLATAASRPPRPRCRTGAAG